MGARRHRARVGARQPRRERGEHRPPRDRAQLRGRRGAAAVDHRRVCAHPVGVPAPRRRPRRPLRAQARVQPRRDLVRHFVGGLRPRAFGALLDGGTCTAGRRGGVARSRQSSHSRGQLSRAGSLHGDRRLERARGSRAGYWTLRRRLPRSHRFLEMGVSRQTFRLRWPRSGSCSAMYRRRTIRLRHRISISVARCSRPSASAASRMPLSNRLRMGCTQSTSPERAPAA